MVTTGISECPEGEVYRNVLMETYIGMSWRRSISECPEGDVYWNVLMEKYITPTHWGIS